MTIRDEAEQLSKEAHEIYMRIGDERVDDLALLVKRLCELVMACAPEFKEAP